MKKTHPPFHSSGDPKGDFFAVAFVAGTYVSPSQKDTIEGFLTLYFSLSKGFTRFTYHTISTKGDLIAYRSGVEDPDSLEYALLYAWEDYHVPPYRWKLFPGRAIDQSKFKSSKTRKAYEDTRKKFSSIALGSRMHAWYEFKDDLKPMFQITDERPGNPLERTPENNEINGLFEDYVLGSKTSKLRKRRK